MKKSFAVIALLAIAVGFAACRKQSPDDRALAALGRGDYDTQFWTDQAKRNTPLWRRAGDYCDQLPASSARRCARFLGLIAAQVLTAGGGNVPPPQSAPPGTLGIVTPKTSEGGKHQ